MSAGVTPPHSQEQHLEPETQHNDRQPCLNGSSFVTSTDNEIEKEAVVHDRLHFLHFNDVYNIEACDGADPCGGAARFVTLLRSLRETGVAVGKNNSDVVWPAGSPPPLLLFSGDAFNPSLMSTVTKGTLKRIDVFAGAVLSQIMRVTII